MSEPRQTTGNVLRSTKLVGEAASALKRQIVESLRDVAERFEWIESATVTGSFLHGVDLEGISDIDHVVIVDRLNKGRMEELQAAYVAALEPILEAHGFRLRINPTLGPLKFNDAMTAVLHLMLYTRDAHIDHVIKSPFTCLDWQRSQAFFKKRMQEVYPVFCLQPRHFVSARRGIRDYLKDYRRRVVSFRELACDENGYRELGREKEMNTRDRHEFAFHILRFLMQNLLKLANRRNETVEGDLLLEAFAREFGACERRAVLYRELARKKRLFDFASDLPGLDARLEHCVDEFAKAFHERLGASAIRHVWFRHARTNLNHAPGEEPRFLGRGDPSIVPPEKDDVRRLQEVAARVGAGNIYSSPLTRCQESARLVNESATMTVDARLAEIDYGLCEGHSVSQAKQRFPELFEAWTRGEDPNFPAGESVSDVQLRLARFLSSLSTAQTSSLISTHNVVLRTLIGELMGIPKSQWHRIQIPHMTPITTVFSPTLGWYIDLDEEVERACFAGFRGSSSVQ